MCAVIAVLLLRRESKVRRDLTVNWVRVAELVVVTVSTALILLFLWSSLSSAGAASSVCEGRSVGYRTIVGC